MKQFLSRSSVFFGVVSGILCFVVIVILYVSKNWDLQYTQLWFTILFTLITTSCIILGALGDKKIIKRYSYWQAFLACIIVSLLSAGIRQIGNQIMVRIVDKDLPNITKSAIIKAQKASYEKFKMPADKAEKMIEEIERKPSLYFFSFWVIISDIIGKLIIYGIISFAIAPFVKSKEKWYEEPPQIDTSLS